MSARQNLLVAGEALIDLMPSADGSTSAEPGGSPFNLALALGRLGCNTIYRSPLSSDAYGRRLAEQLRASGVALGGGEVEQPTSLAIVKVDAAGRAAYEFRREGVADRTLAPLQLLNDWPADAHFFHVGSLALMPPDGELWRDLLQALRARFVTTSVDVNMRPMAAADRLDYARTGKRVCQQAHLLKVSEEDLLALALPGDPLACARSLMGDATRLVLLTLGAQGAWCLTREHEIFRAAPTVQVLDTVGAGDCFYAGFLASLDEQRALHRTPSAAELGQAMQLGAQATAFNLQRKGCQPPWRKELAGVSAVLTCAKAAAQNGLRL